MPIVAIRRGPLMCSAARRRRAPGRRGRRWPRGRGPRAPAGARSCAFALDRRALGRAVGIRPELRPVALEPDAQRAAHPVLDLDAAPLLVAVREVAAGTLERISFATVRGGERQGAAWGVRQPP